MSDFEDSFVKILNAKERKARKEKAETRGRKPKPLNFGDTTAGKVLATGAVPQLERHSIHEIPAARTHASGATPEQACEKYCGMDEAVSEEMIDYWLERSEHA
jgi:hypothetical protein